MNVLAYRVHILLVTVVAALCMMALPATAHAYGGVAHEWAAKQAVWLMAANYPWEITRDSPLDATRERLGAPIYPELTARGQLFTDWAYQADDSMYTINHFWEAEDGLHELPEGYAGVENAWEMAELYWELAQTEWWIGNVNGAYIYLGHVAHLMMDGGQPAHTNSDLHIAEDSLEEWFQHPDFMYVWNLDGASTIPEPGPIFTLPGDQQIVLDVLAADDWQPGQMEFVMQGDLVNPNAPMDKQRLFYLMYRVNQTGNFFASDGENGNRRERIGWLNEYPGFPTHLHDYGVRVTPQDEHALDDNEVDCPINDPDCVWEGNHGQCNCDDDLRRIAKWAYGASFRATPALLDAFRRSVDNASPITTPEITRRDGADVQTWNNSSVLVRLASAVDRARPGVPRASGVWMIWGLCDDQEPANAYAPSWLLETDGMHTIKLRTTDQCGNIEHRSVQVGVDTTAPTLVFPEWPTHFYPCESPMVTWSATDATSGIQLVTAKLDGQPVAKNKPLSLSGLDPGEHTVLITAHDRAGNQTVTGHVFTLVEHVGLEVGAPVVKRVLAHTFRFTGTLEPQHTAGTSPVTIALQKRVDGVWKLKGRVAATINAAGDYRCTVKLAAGSWRAQARHKYPTAISGYSRFTVR